MKDRPIFIDTNIFVYAKLEHEQNKIKKQYAQQLLKSLKVQIIVSTQVLNEFSNVLIRNRIDDEKIQDTLEAIIEECDVCPVDLKTVEKAWYVRIKYQFSFWDSLIVASALGMDCSVLFTEDLQHNQIIEEKLKTINPFIGSDNGIS